MGYFLKSVYLISNSVFSDFNLLVHGLIIIFIGI